MHRRLASVLNGESKRHASLDGVRWADAVDDETFWARLRSNVLPLRPSQYDLTSRCNLTCEGCLFFSGPGSAGRQDAEDPAIVDAHFAAEAARGIRFGYFGGAEPSLVEHKLVTAARHIPYGTVFTNGTRRLSDEIPYRIHVSVWGRPERDRELRGASMLAKQVRNYRGDKRVVFVFTVTARNIDDLPWIASFCADEDLALTFNHYSPTAHYTDFLDGVAAADRYHGQAEGELTLRGRDLARARDTIDALLDEAQGRILYSHAFGERAHDPAGWYPDLEGPAEVPRDCGSLLNKSFRHYETDLQAGSGKCCTPNVSCATCRLYAQSFATALLRATRTLRLTGGRERSIPLWRLWCALFLNDEVLSAWPPPSDGMSVDGLAALPVG